MTLTDNLERFNGFTTAGARGSGQDVDFLMGALLDQDDLATTRLVDFALGLVDTREGRERLRHYLFGGSPVQRNYAALYFKRRGWKDLLDEAVAQGKIDRVQAYLQ